MPNNIIEELFNRVFYSIFKMASLEPLQKPLNWLMDNCFYKLPFVVKRLKKLGYTVEEYKQLFSDKKGKMTLHDKRLSSQIMVVCMAMTMIELFYLFTILTGRDNWYAGDNTKTHTIIIYFSLGFCVLLAEWYYIDRKSKYKRYFKKFEKETRKKHIVWYLITLIWIVSPFFIFNIIDEF